MIKLFTIKCPKCKGRLHAIFLDMQFDKLVWKCNSCGGEYI